MFFFLSTVMAILPVYTTSKLHAARINLKHLAQHLGYRSATQKGVVFGRKWAWFAKNFRGRASAPDLTNPLHEILDPPLPKRSETSGS